MNQKVISISPRLRANPLRTRVSFQSALRTSPFAALQHPALSQAVEAEEVSIHHSLDISFRQTIAVSHVDRQIIDDLSRRKDQGSL